MKLAKSISILFVIISTEAFAQPVAFPGAEGFGAQATGGRGGSVYQVTNLKDAGSGSLRDGVKKNNCTVIFRVSGYIHLKSALNITGNSLTIAGQTAPGDGICVRGYPTFIKADNVVVRYMRFRLGDENNLKSDAFDINDQKNIIIDHCSLSWGVDECASWYHNENVTIQWCIIGEGLDYAGHTMGGLWGGQSSYHHNLIYSCGTRHPKFAYTVDADITDHRNNVIYNWGYESAYTSPTGRVNIIANYYKPGPSTKSAVRNRIVYSEYTTKRLYVNNNYMHGNPEVTRDNWNGGVGGKPIKHDTPFPAPAVTTQSAEEAYKSVLVHVGASLKRDLIDQRVINEVKNGKGKIIKRQSEVGGFPDLQSIAAPPDSDADGMPDGWETAKGLNPNDAKDRNGTGNDGYTNLEIYLNSIVAVQTTSIVQTTKEPIANNLFLIKSNSNQFNPAKKIIYTLPVSGNVTLEIYNSIGQRVAVIINENKAAGRHEMYHNVSGLGSGLFLYLLSINRTMMTRRMFYNY